VPVALPAAAAAVVLAACVTVGAVRAVLPRRRRAAAPRRIARLAGPDRLLQALDVAIAAMHRPGLRGGAVLLINERNELYFGAHRGEADDRVRAIRLPLGVGVMGRAAAEGRPVVVDDLDAPPPGVQPTNRSTGSNALSRSLVAVPILRDGGVIGLLEMGCTRPHAFGAADVALLERCAAAMAPAVAQANPVKLADEVLRRRVRELTSLQGAAEALSSSMLGMEQLLPTVAEHAARALHTPYAAVLAVEDGRVRIVADHAGQANPGVAEVRQAAAELAGQARPGEARTAALPPPPGEAPPPTDPHAPLRSAGLVRLRPAGQLDLVVAVASPDPRGFDPAQLRLLEGVADLATLAVANAERYRRLAQASATDALTGLLRRSEFERALAGAGGETLSVLAIDVDGLRQVNESAGHEAGDAALAAVARTLRERLGGMGVLARTGGDEFGVLLPGVHHVTAVAIAEELRRSVHGTHVVIPWLPRVSIGLATATEDTDPRSAWDSAVEALALAKRWGRDRVESGRRPLAGPAPKPQSWEVLLPRLFEPGALGTVYQPLVRLADGHLAGYEALARPSGFGAEADVDGLFLAARAAGVHRDLDWLCRRSAVEGAAGLPPGIPLFLNVNVWSLLDPLHGVDQMLLLLRSVDLPAGDVVLEISERDQVHDLERLHEVLSAYRSHGFRFSIDDVGEGHSTLDVLAASAPEFVKIAGSVVRAADRPGAHAAIEAVVAFARSSQAAVVAERIETPEQAERMAAMGVTLGFGRWLGPPVTLGVPTVVLHARAETHAPQLRAG